ncbi:hypothetical protein [Ornithinimicrobium cryptoxanthini]|uniref:Lipoprotein n=1 Tax=Ornithinimicrobium cryptoxanthini TaxID=2934161 RepID=A0ABY4YH40_9MICO|nr:hypothetical protein [Ornithinimicrobium cryptoxanthini]USQ75590.1 hypothetical protein NF557_13355 [Ornithinimicrobium cryptoxanthini]
MRTQHTARGRLRGAGRITRGALPVAALVLLAACGSESEPDVGAPPASTQPTDSEPTTDTAEKTDKVATNDDDQVTATPQPTTVEPTTESSPEPTTESSAEPPEEGAGEPASQGLAVAQSYAELLIDGAMDEAYAMLSPESMAYFPDVSVFEENGVAGLAEDLGGASGEPQWAIRSAYEETHDSAQVVSVWGEGGDGEPFAHSWAVRKLDGMSWVIDQDITSSAGEPRLNWLNPGIQEGVEWWVVNPDSPISFALLKSSGPNVAVTASIDDGDEVSQQLTERPTGGAVMFDLSDSALSDGLHVVTASWVAEDEPFVHTSATPAANPAS